MFKDLIKSKTFWTGIIMVASGVMAYLNGDQTQGINTALQGLGLVFLRHAVSKTGAA